ncbi:MAG TPA: hypothetical protein VJT16_07195 [Streptosporangiaceae bacterium]|nr:hypothetical protein [Streptosporangiaceae bacterium]
MRRALVALLAAAAAFMAAGPAFASIPAHPKWRSSDPFGSWHNGGYIVYNNEWNGGHGPQSIWANSYKYWGAVSKQKAGNTAVETYPCVQKNYSNVPISSMKLLRTGFTEYMPSNKSGLDAEAANDVWLNNYNIEVMIWVDNHGQRPAGNVIDHVTIYGQHFTVWKDGSDYFTFALSHNENKGVTHILASINWLIHHHQLAANVTLTQVNFGWEIASTGGQSRSFIVKNFWLRDQR